MSTAMTRHIPLITPGEILAQDWLGPFGLSHYALAKAIGVPPRRINEIVKGERAITADIAIRLGAYFHTDPQSWMRLQSHYDMELARERIGEDVLRKIEHHEFARTA